MKVPPFGIAQRVCDWQAVHGRHDLPWQNSRDPYRVWVSEIMLQQTQVRTVIGYFARFMARFPSVSALAAASQDEVLALWSGLGYYSRARNLHACAQAVVQAHGGRFPRSAAQLATLPGIGLSTAAAIASLCFDERVAILDANVRRVLSRVLGFAGDLARAAHVRALWEAAQALLPPQGAPAPPGFSMPRYTQGVMDLGATVCLPRQPRCSACPLADVCVARARDRVQDYPLRTRNPKRSAQHLWLAWLSEASGAVWLDKRPAPGVWAGLYCLPLFDSEEALLAALSGVPHTATRQALPPFLHGLTHKDLHIHPWRVQLAGRSVQAGAAVLPSGAWFAADRWPALGLPAPVRRLLQTGSVA